VDFSASEFFNGIGAKQPGGASRSLRSGRHVH
jgi:hypothetical protein